MTANINEDIESRLGKLSYYCGHHELMELKSKVDSKLKDLKEQPVYVMIVGDGKRGKSTLLNALIGQNLAEVNFLPKTWRIDTYTTTNDKEYAELVWEENGKERKEKTTFEKAFATCKEIENKQKEISKKLEEWKTDLKQINWFVKSKWNLSGRALVDTPGFSQLRADTSIKAQTLYNASGIQVQREDGFSYYYYRADLVLWCISATKLEDAEALGKLMEVKSQNKQIIGIITFMDRIPKERWNDVKKSAEKVYGNYISKFIFSAAGAQDLELKSNTVKEIMAAVDEFTLGKEKYIKHIEAEKFYNHNSNELKNLIKQIASLFTDNYIQYHNLFDSTLESLSTHEDSAIEKISSYLADKRNLLINALDGIWLLSHEQPNIFAEEIKNRIPVRVCNSEFEKTYRQLTDNFYAVFRVVESTDYKAVKLGQNSKAVEIKLDNLNTGKLVLHNANTINISRFDSLRGKAAGQGAKEFFGDNLVGEIFEGLGKLISSGRIKREKIGGAQRYINEIFDDLENQYTEYIENLSEEFVGKIKSYMYDKFKIINGGNEKAVLTRIFDIENTLNNLNLYEDNETIVFNNTLIKSFYIPKIISRCKYYFNIYNKELKDFIDHHIDELQKHNKNKIAAAFKNVVIDVENEPVIFDIAQILNVSMAESKEQLYGKYPANIANVLTAFNSWKNNIYWEEKNLSIVDKLNLLTDDNKSIVQKRYNKAVKSNKKYFDELYVDYSSRWDNLVKQKLEDKLKEYEKKFQFEKRFNILKNLVNDSLKEEINYNSIEKCFYFEPEKLYYDNLYKSLEHSYFNNLKGQSYKFYDGKSTKDYIELRWRAMVNLYRSKVVDLENEYAKKLNQKITEYIDGKFNEYIKTIDNVTDFKEDLKLFKNKCDKFVNSALTQSNKDSFEMESDELFNKYYKDIDIDFSFFYPESSKKNIYFKVNSINSYISDKLDNLIYKELDELNDIFDKATVKWDLRVYNYCREYYSKLIVNKAKNKNIFDSEIIKGNLFDIIKRQYTMDHYVLGQIDRSIDFKSKIIYAINFSNILNQNVIPDDLAFDLEIDKEISKNYKIFEDNLLKYMEEQLYEICQMFFKEKNSLKFKLFKGKNSEFVAETLNKLFSSYILDKDGVLL